MVNCPRCERDTSVGRTVKRRGFVVRERSCPCGIAFETDEVVVPSSIRAKVGVVRRPVTPEMRQAVMARDGATCRACGATDSLVIDHVTPLAAPVPDGRSREEETEWRNSTDNMQALCTVCNATKGASTADVGLDLGVGKGGNFALPVAQGPVAPQKKGGDISGSGSVLRLFPEDPEEKDPPKSAPADGRKLRGKAREYSAGFLVCWALYGRHEEKWQAYLAFRKEAQNWGSEQELADAITGALKKQTPKFEGDAWQFAPFFERYIRRRKWEDETTKISTPAQGQRTAGPRPGAGWSPAARGKNYREGLTAAAPGTGRG